MKPTLARIADLWCRLMHKESIWPSHGYYECRTCGRKYRVFWEQASPATPHELALSCETESRGAFATEIESRTPCP